MADQTWINKDKQTQSRIEKNILIQQKNLNLKT